jgi:hypothetical protein
VLTRDLTGDGINDTWALTTFHQDFLEMALPSNNAAFVGIDPVTGRFINTTQTPEFLQTIEFMVQLRTEMLTMHEMDIGAEWNFFIDAFNNGTGAMRAAYHFAADAQILGVLQDPWGFVAFPRGPSGTGHMSEILSNFNAIPHFFNEQEVEDIMFAWALWQRPLPDAEDDDWIFAEYTRHYDRRSVDETMVMYTRNALFQRVPVWRMMPGAAMPRGEQFAFRVWNGMYDAVTIVEEAQQVWDERIRRSNVRMGFDE